MKNIRGRTKRSNEDVIARAIRDALCFSSLKSRAKKGRRRRLKVVSSRTGFGAPTPVVIATDATSAFVKTSRRSTLPTTVLRSSFSCVDDDAAKGDLLEDEGCCCLLVDEKRLVVVLVGVEVMLVAANMSVMWLGEASSFVSHNRALRE